MLETLFATAAKIAAAERIRAAIGRGAAAGACVLLAVWLAAVALLCAFAALWMFLLPQVGPIYAPLIVSGVLLTISLLILLVARRVTRRRRPTTDAAELGALLVTAEQMLREHKGEALLAALVAGLVAGMGVRRQ